MVVSDVAADCQAEFDRYGVSDLMSYLCLRAAPEVVLWKALQQGAFQQGDRAIGDRMEIPPFLRFPELSL